MALHAWFQIMLCLCILLMLLVSSTLCFVALDSTQGGRNGGRTLTAACIRRKALKTLPFLKSLQYRIHTRLQAQHAQCLAVVLYQSCYSPANGLCVPMPSAPQGADALERATRVKIVIFDKTGTLTKGKPSVTNSRVFLKGKLLCTKTVELGLSDLTSGDASSMHTSANSLDGLHLGPCLPQIVALSLATWCVGCCTMLLHAGFPEEEFLHLAAAAEASSEHPLGKAITAHARVRLQRSSWQGDSFTLCIQSWLWCLRHYQPQGQTDATLLLECFSNIMPQDMNKLLGDTLLLMHCPCHAW